MKKLIAIILILISNYGSSQSFFATVSGGPTSDGQVELGMKFTTSANATITGLRFYKVNAGTQTYTLKLYSGTTLMTSTTYSGSATGWVIANITPVAVIPGVTYTVSYYSPAGYYQAANPYNLWPVSNGPLLATGSVYSYKSGNNNTLPANTFQTSNYFVDLVRKIDTIVPPPVPKDSITVDGELYVRASTIKPPPKDSTIWPFDMPDSSELQNWNGMNYKVYYFTKQADTVKVPYAIYKTDSAWALQYVTDLVKNGGIDFSEFYKCDTPQYVIGWDGMDSVDYPTYFKNLRYFKIMEVTNLGDPLHKFRYVEFPKMAMRKEESFDGGLTWQIIVE